MASRRVLGSGVAAAGQAAPSEQWSTRAAGPARGMPPAPRARAARPWTSRMGERVRSQATWLCCCRAAALVLKAEALTYVACVDAAAHTICTHWEAGTGMSDRKSFWVDKRDMRETALVFMPSS